MSINERKIRNNMKKNIKEINFFIIQKYIEKNYIEVKELEEHKIRFSLY